MTPIFWNLWSFCPSTFWYKFICTDIIMCSCIICRIFLRARGAHQMTNILYLSLGGGGEGYLKTGLMNHDLQLFSSHWQLGGQKTPCVHSTSITVHQQYKLKQRGESFVALFILCMCHTIVIGGLELCFIVSCDKHLEIFNIYVLHDLTTSSLPHQVLYMSSK